MAFKLGCQTITFGADQTKDFPSVFAAVAKAGYDGVELGFRHVAAIAPAELKKMLAAHGLELTALHQGGKLDDPAQVKDGKGLVEQIVAYLNAMGVKFLLYSGLNHKEDEPLFRDIEALNNAARVCAAGGVQMCYHNHDWEFGDNRRILKALLGRADPALRLGVDVGWVYKGGQDVVAFLESVKDRVAYAHFKDFASVEGDRRNFTELGRGSAPLKAIAGWFKRNKSGLWIVAEQDKSNLPAAEAVAINAACLKSLFAA